MRGRGGRTPENIFNTNKIFKYIKSIYLLSEKGEGRRSLPIDRERGREEVN
jgi:hypothetical protein